MPENFEDLRITHEVDQAIEELLKIGKIHVVGVDDNGDARYALTSKGVVSGSMLTIQAFIAIADFESRDFTPQEKAEVLEHLRKAVEALEKDE